VAQGTGPRDGTGSPGHWVSDFGRVDSGHGSVCQTLSDPVFDPVLSFNMRVYRGVVSAEQHHLDKPISAYFHAVYSKSTDSDNLLML